MLVESNAGDLLKRVVRYDELRPLRNAFIDTRTPGSEEKENFQVIGGGVVENPNKHVHITIPHGFNMGGSRMPAGCQNSQHSHDTGEVFMVHKGTFAITLGPDREDGELEVREGDVVSIPTMVFRGFRNSGEGVGHLISVLEGDRPGKVVWAPSVFEQAKEFGLVLLENGVLVDTVAGETVPEGVAPVKPTTKDDLKAFKRLTPEGMEGWYARSDSLKGAPNAPLAGPGVEECPVIGVANPAENMPEAPIGAPHTFQMRRVRMQAGASIPMHARHEVEVLFVQRGSVEVEMEDGQAVALNKGDYFSIPVGSFRKWRNAGSQANDVQVVRGGDYPKAPTWK